MTLGKDVVYIPRGYRGHAPNGDEPRPRACIPIKTRYRTYLSNSCFETGKIYFCKTFYTLSEAWSGVNWADLMATQGAFGPIFLTGLPER